MRVYNGSMVIFHRLPWMVLAAGLSSSGFLPAQTLSNKSLTGKFSFRETLLAADTSQLASIWGTLTFDGNTPGNFTCTGQQITGNALAAGVNKGGTYSVDSGGLVTMSDPLRSGAMINARLGTAALVGSNTETDAVLSMFVAVPAPTSAITASVLTGSYWVASLEFLSGDLSLRRETFFQMTANGGGGFGNPVAVLGEAGNLSDKQVTQMVTGATYAVNADGTGTATFPIPNAADPARQLLGGTKTIYIAQDGSFFFGGGTDTGSHGLLIGIRTAANATNAILSGLYWSADLRLERQNYSSYAGSAIVQSSGTLTWSRRLRSNTAVQDVTAVTPYSVNGNGSGTAIDNDIAVSANGQLFLGSGLAIGDTQRYELFFAVRAPALSGSGIFLNPQGVVNVFSFAPAGSPISPGEFITIFGTGLPLRSSVVPPFPPSLNGVQLLINNKPVPLYLITATQVLAVVPFSVTGPTATIVLDNSGTRSNTITVPVAATSPGIASAAQSGVGAGAIQHHDFSPVTAQSPAQRGETIIVYATGLGQVSPAAPDGGPAPGDPFLSRTNSVLAVYFGATCQCDPAGITYQGLTPTYAGLYQINVTIPLNASPGLAVPLAILTPNGFTDMVDIAIQ